MVRPGSSPLASLRFPPAHVPTPEGWKAELALTDLTPQSLTEVPNLPPACMACMCVPPQLAGGNPLVGPNSFKTLGEGPRLVPPKREFPLLIVPTPEGWKAEYTLASRMQIHESLTVLALLTRDEARTSDPWICSLMLYHLSYLTTTYIHTYIHTYTHILIQAKSRTCLRPLSLDFKKILGTVHSTLILTLYCMLLYLSTCLQRSNGDMLTCFTYYSGIAVHLQDRVRQL